MVAGVGGVMSGQILESGFTRSHPKVAFWRWLQKSRSIRLAAWLFIFRPSATPSSHMFLQRDWFELLPRGYWKEEMSRWQKSLKIFLGASGAVELDWHIAQWKKPVRDGLRSRCRRFSDSLFIGCNHPLIAVVAPHLYSALSKTWGKCHPFGIKKKKKKKSALSNTAALSAAPRL